MTDTIATAIGNTQVCERKSMGTRMHTATRDVIILFNINYPFMLRQSDADVL